MTKSRDSESSGWASSWDGHRRQQILHWARNTTPADRLKWVESMLIYMAKTGKTYQDRERMFQGK